MNILYDNGEKIVGKIENIEKYLIANLDTSDMQEEIKAMLEDLKDLNSDSIVCINYDNGMGYIIDYWSESDKVEL